MSYNYYDDTEVFNADYGYFNYYEDLPRPAAFHVITMVNDTHIIFLGGASTYYDDVWIFSRITRSWTQLPDLPQGKQSLQAGVVTYPNGQKKLVVAGGYRDSTTSILDLDTLTYYPGPNLPYDIYYGSSVQFGNTFLIAGGYSYSLSNDLDTIFEFDPSNELWIERTEKMQQGNYAMAAFMVPDGYIECV